MKSYLPLLSAIAFSLIACSNDDVAGYTTVETENALLITVTYQDETPVARRVATLRPLSYVRDFSDIFETPQMMVIGDSLGQFAIDSLPFQADTFTLELLAEGQGVFRKIPSALLDVSDDSVATMDLVMEDLGSISGKTDCLESSGNVWVQIYGTDRLVLTDDSCNFHIDSLAPAEYKLRVLMADSVIETEVTVVPDGDTQIDIRVEESNEVEIINFENGFNASLNAPALEGTGYFAVSDSTVESTPTPETSEEGFVEAGAGREGTAYHWTSNSPTGRWAFFGIFICHSDTPCDMQGLDSVEFYVRGKGRYSLAMESLGDSTFNGKAIYYDTLKVDSAAGRNDVDAWIRKVVRPSDFIAGDSSWANLGWELVSQKVTTLTIATYGEAEIWIDDIKLYGIKPSDLK
ncbi:MAG: hypothetical protein IK114_08935 [Fibrobacter sp.]|nr:hypothetical protein [Fibrobacter sp.]